MVSPIVTRGRATATRLLLKHGFAGVLKYPDVAPVPGSSIEIAGPGETFPVRVVPFTTEAITGSELGRTESGTTLIAGASLTSPPPMNSTLTVGSKTWVVTASSPFPDDGSETAADVALFQVGLER